MNQNYENDIKWFKEIINKPETLKLLPKQYLENPDFLETFYIILGDKIKPYISNQTFETLKHREVIFKNQNMQKIKNKPNISLDDELELLHKLLTDIETINLLPTDEKYTNNCIQFLYLIWGDEIENYIPYEMFEEIKNEKLMKKYHESHNQEQEKWAKEVDQKIKLLSK